MTTYSTYEAKARLSEILRLVRQGKTITISHRGEPVAEIRPLERGANPLENRIRRLEREGVLQGPSTKKRTLRTIARRPGALKRFLAEREE